MHRMQRITADAYHLNIPCVPLLARTSPVGNLWAKKTEATVLAKWLKKFNPALQAFKRVLVDQYAGGGAGEVEIFNCQSASKL